MQPEALRLARRLGKRFGRSSPTASVLTGTVTIGGSAQPITITRRQFGIGENVELIVASRALTWGANEGARAVSSTPTETERLLIERLVYDSPDYFVLAQLGRASYFTVARNMRPGDAPDNYDGPLWTVVRVDDQSDQRAAALSRWRLYYLNSSTGLIDKVISETQGERIEAIFSDWIERAGEKFPSTIRWTIQGQTLMSFNLANVTLAAE
jgi:hypothetical protein